MAVMTYFDNAIRYTLGVIQTHVPETITGQCSQLYSNILPIGMGVAVELLICPYPLKVQACPPWDRRPANRSKVSGQEGM